MFINTGNGHININHIISVEWVRGEEYRAEETDGSIVVKYQADYQGECYSVPSALSLAIKKTDGTVTFVNEEQGVSVQFYLATV